MGMVLEEPNMSDTTILVTVEDLINRTMGPPNANVVDFKLVQMILEILAKQQRMLQQRVEIRVIELEKQRSKKKTARDVSSGSSSKIPRLNQSLRTVGQKHKSQQRPKSKDAERDVLRETSLGKQLNEQEENTLKKEQNKEIKQQKKTQKEEYRIGKEVMKARKELDKVEKLQQKGQKDKERLEKADKPKNLQNMAHKQHVTLEKEELGDISKHNQERKRYEKSQICERMKSAEDYIAKIIEMLTLLAATGALPEHIAGQVETLLPPTYKEANRSQPLLYRKPVATDTQAPRDLKLQPSMSPEQFRPLEEDKSIATDAIASRPQTMEHQATHGLNLQPSKSSEQTVIEPQPLVAKKSEAIDARACKPQVTESPTSRDLNLQPSLSPEESIARPIVFSK
ncbi:jg25694, partial [Pararge aegeria aegeria]